MRQIRQLDVAQDSILTATKLTGTQLILYASEEYLSKLKLTPQSFVARVFGLEGRRERHRDEEKVVFYRNGRDPSVTSAIEAACRTLNARKLLRDGRRLRYVLEDEPRPTSDPGGCRPNSLSVCRPDRRPLLPLVRGRRVARTLPARLAGGGT